MRPVITSSVRILAAWAALCLLAVAAQAQEPPTDNAAASDTSTSNMLAENELQTMARVVEDSITQSGLKDWQGPSTDLAVFEPLTKAQYIPTVGAIFTLRVGFCIVEPQAPEQQPATQEKGNEDLWEKHSSAAEGADPAQRGLQEILSLNETVMSASRGTKYDAEKVRLLRQSIIGALAKYGCRMEHVKDSERILVVVEAPKQGGGMCFGEGAMGGFHGGAFSAGGGGGGYRGGGGFGGGSGGGGGGFGGGSGGGGYGGGGVRFDGGAEGSGKGVSVSGGSGGAVVAFGGTGGIGGFATGGPGAENRTVTYTFGTRSVSDRLLLAVTKSDVASATTPEQLEAKVKELRF